MNRGAAIQKAVLNKQKDNRILPYIQKNITLSKEDILKRLQTSLPFAIKAENIDAIKFILENEGDPNLGIHQAVLSPNAREYTRLLVEYGADLHFRVKYFYGDLDIHMNITPPELALKYGKTNPLSYFEDIPAIEEPSNDETSDVEEDSSFSQLPITDETTYEEILSVIGDFSTVEKPYVMKEEPFVEEPSPVKPPLPELNITDETTLEEILTIIDGLPLTEKDPVNVEPSIIDETVVDEPSIIDETVDKYIWHEFMEKPFDNEKFEELLKLKIDKNIVEAAKGMGMTQQQLFFKIELVILITLMPIANVHFVAAGIQFN